MQIARGLGFLNISRKFGVRTAGGDDDPRKKLAWVRTASMVAPRVASAELTAPRAAPAEGCRALARFPNLRVLPACASLLQNASAFFQCGVKAGLALDVLPVNRRLRTRASLSTMKQVWRTLICSTLSVNFRCGLLSSRPGLPEPPRFLLSSACFDLFADEMDDFRVPGDVTS